jgi:hypothetical protein
MCILQKSVIFLVIYGYCCRIRAVILPQCDGLFHHYLAVDTLVNKLSH